MKFTIITALLSCVCLANERPNIILVMADDMGWGDPSYNSGWINTPALDAMAAEGLRFDRFYSASAVCSPTRASCLTGRHPLRFGITHANEGRLEADETPLSEVLGGVGYATGHFGKWHLGTLTSLRSDGNRGAVGNTAD
ncbi:sulfatase-like hydrolase/transferase, partial [bacterium]|nr:sulfatase-like hydrolase/transferase [bacterium]